MEGIASYVTIEVEYFVAVVNSNGLAPDEPDLESTGQEDEIGKPQREKEEKLEDMKANETVPKPVSNLLLRLRREYCSG